MLIFYVIEKAIQGLLRSGNLLTLTMFMNKRKILGIAAIVNYLIWIAVIINIIAIYPPTVNNLWIYGIVILLTGISSYCIGLILGRPVKLELIGVIVSIIGELMLISYFGLVYQFWVSMYTVPPAITFLVFAIVSRARGHAIRRVLNWAIMIVTAALFFLMIEAAIRVPDFEGNHASIPTWAIVTVVAGLLLYVLTTLHVVEKPSYILALSGAFVVNIGILMLEIYYQLAEITGIFMLLFVPPAAVFFILLLINYKRAPND